MLTAENGFELSMAFVPAMRFTYNESLDIQALGWRCCLFASKPNTRLRLVR